MRGHSPASGSGGGELRWRSSAARNHPRQAHWQQSHRVPARINEVNRLPLVVIPKQRRRRPYVRHSRLFDCRHLSIMKCAILGGEWGRQSSMPLGCQRQEQRFTAIEFFRRVGASCETLVAGEKCASNGRAPYPRPSIGASNIKSVMFGELTQDSSCRALNFEEVQPQSNITSTDL